MINIAFGDWFLARSEGFRVIIQKLRDHKITTKRSFSRVKRKHNHHDRRFDEHDKRIKEIEKVIENLYETPLIKKKKSSKN